MEPRIVRSLEGLPLTYLTCPYSHPDPAVREARWVAVTKAAAWLMNELRWNVFSPITHSHPLHTIAGMRGDWEFWKQVDTEYLQISCRMVNLMLPGWQDSTGVTAENTLAKEFDLPVLWMVPRGPDNYELTTIQPIEQTLHEYLS